MKWGNSTALVGGELAVGGSFDFIKFGKLWWKCGDFIGAAKAATDGGLSKILTVGFEASIGVGLTGCIMYGW